MLLVGDDAALRDLFAHLIGLRGHPVLGASDVDEAIQLCRTAGVGVVVIENVMPGGTWAGLAHALLDLLGADAPPVVMLAGSWAQGDANASQPGVCTMMAPHRADQLLDLVSRYCSGIRRLV